MKKIVWMAMLSAGISTQSIAQTRANRTSIQGQQVWNYSRSYSIDLKTGNSMQVEYYDRVGPKMHTSIDSLMNIALGSYKLIADSLPNDYFARKMEIRLYDTVLRSINWSGQPAAEKRILIFDSTRNQVKFLQDTVVVNVFRILPAIGKTYPASLKITLVLNNMRKLSQFVTGKYEALFDSLETSTPKDWYIYNEEGKRFKNNPLVQSLSVYDQQTLRTSISPSFSMSLQHYRDHIVPSVKSTLNIFVDHNYLRREFGIGHEFDFTFQPGTDGRSASFASQFMTLSYNTRRLTNDYGKGFTILPALKVGYMIVRKGTVFDAHSFKLGIGHYGLFHDRLAIEPTFYFQDLFKHITPSFRITQSF